MCLRCTARIACAFCALRHESQGDAMNEQRNLDVEVKALVVRAQAYLCALPLELVIEAMRPLPVSAPGR